MADSSAFIRAKAFRKAMTPPETRLWSQLRASRLAGVKFRRQHPVGPYILDFYCPSARLAVEVDGSGHDNADQARHDQARTRWLAHRGIRVIRLSAKDVRDEPDGVFRYLLGVLQERMSDGGAAPS